VVVLEAEKRYEGVNGSHELQAAPGSVFVIPIYATGK